jgi:hypothetical protein
LPTQLIGDFGRAVNQLFGVAGGEERRARVEFAAVPNAIEVGVAREGKSQRRR